jgi:cytochrome b
VSIVLHVLAVIIESVRLRTNLPRAMVTGYKIMNSDR